MTSMIAHMDKLPLRALIGQVKSWTEVEETKPPSITRKKANKIATGEPK